MYNPFWGGRGFGGFGPRFWGPPMRGFWGPPFRHHHMMWNNRFWW